MKIQLILWIVFAFGLGQAQADESTQTQKNLMSFNTWKNQQVLEAQNHVVRLSNRIHILKSKKYRLNERKMELSSPPKEEQSPPPKSLTQDIQQEEDVLKSALEKLQFSKELSFKDYCAVYLGPMKPSKKALSSMVKKLSQEEIAILLEIVLKAYDSSEPKATSPLLSTSFVSDPNQKGDGDSSLKNF